MALSTCRGLGAPRQHQPCAFSVLLVTIAFLFSLGKPRKEVLLLGGSYIVGLYIAYFLIGLGILKALHIFGVPHFMGRLYAAAVIIFGILNLLGYFFPTINWLPGIPKELHQKMAKLLERVSLPGYFWSAFLSRSANSHVPEAPPYDSRTLA